MVIVLSSLTEAKDATLICRLDARQGIGKVYSIYISKY